MSSIHEYCCADQDCDKGYDVRGSLTAHYKYYPSHKPDSWPECPLCSERHKDLGKHWSGPRCDHPELNDHQKQASIGIMMGDGTLGLKDEENQRIEIQNFTTPEYLQYLTDLFGCISTGARDSKTAVESAKDDINSGFNPNAKEENYSDAYNWKTRSHPSFNVFNSWYDGRDKIFPGNVSLSPVVLKHWYVCDGHYDNSGSNRQLSIGIYNERKNKSKIETYFREVGMPEPNNYQESDRGDGKLNCSARWNVKETEKLFEYMGDPLPGFEYKWPDDYC